MKNLGKAVAGGIWLTIRGLYTAVNILWTTALIIALGTLAYLLFTTDDSSTDIMSSVEVREYAETPAPVEFDFGALDISESTMAPGLTDAERDERMTRSIVSVETPMGFGSGVLIDNQRCLVVTNEHVVAVAGELKSSYIVRRRANGEIVSRTVDAEILGRPSDTEDLAIIKLASCDNLPWAPLGNSDELLAGQTVMAIGHPHGLGWTVSEGIVTNAARFWMGTTVANGYPLIQLDAAISHGNSGGGLFTTDGALVGINSMGDLEGENLGFARSSNLLAAYMGRLAADGRVYDRNFGMVAEENDDGTLTISEVSDNGRAAFVGLRAGDELLAVNGAGIDGAPSLKRAIYTDTDGVVELIVLRDGGYYRLTIDYNQERRS